MWSFVPVLSEFSFGNVGDSQAMLRIPRDNPPPVILDQLDPSYQCEVPKDMVLLKFCSARDDPSHPASAQRPPGMLLALHKGPCGVKHGTGLSYLARLYNFSPVLVSRPFSVSTYCLWTMVRFILHALIMGYKQTYAWAHSFILSFY